MPHFVTKIFAYEFVDSRWFQRRGYVSPQGRKAKLALSLSLSVLPPRI